MSTTAVVVALVLTGLGTLAVRGSALVFADRLSDVSPRTQTVLSMIPPATLAALVAPALLRPEGTFAPLGPQALAGLVALAVAWRTRNLLATIVVGLVAVVALELVIG